MKHQSYGDVLSELYYKNYADLCSAYENEYGRKIEDTYVMESWFSDKAMQMAKNQLAPRIFGSPWYAPFYAREKDLVQTYDRQIR